MKKEKKEKKKEKKEMCRCQTNGTGASMASIFRSKTNAHWLLPR